MQGRQRISPGNQASRLVLFCLGFLGLAGCADSSSDGANEKPDLKIPDKEIPEDSGSPAPSDAGIHDHDADAGLPEPSSDTAIHIAGSGDSHTCGLFGRTMLAVCWGDNSAGQTDAPPTQFSSLSLGGKYTCGLRQGDRKVQCWGDNSSGQGSPPSDTTFSSIYGGRAHLCGLRDDDDTAVCWGANSEGQATPPAGISFTSLSAGATHTCGIRKSDSLIQCWGSMGGAATPADVEATQISHGASHACAITKSTSTTVCWGENGQGQASAPAGVTFQQVAAGDTHSCGLTKQGGRAQCWGDNSQGQLDAPRDIEFESVTAGKGFSCGVRKDNQEAVCWGRNDVGQLTPPETCEEDTDGDSVADCIDPLLCGDGQRSTLQGEFCDDGNLQNGDGCNVECRPESLALGETTETVPVVATRYEKDVEQAGPCDDGSVAVGVVTAQGGSTGARDVHLTTLGVRCQPLNDTYSLMGSPYPSDTVGTKVTTRSTDCTDGRVMIGATISYNDVLKQVVAHCLYPAEIYGQTSRERGFEETTPTIGATFAGASKVQMLCPAGAAVVGVTGHSNTGGALSEVSFVCRSLKDASNSP